MLRSLIERRRHDGDTGGGGKNSAFGLYISSTVILIAQYLLMKNKKVSILNFSIVRLIFVTNQREIKIAIFEI